MAKPKLTIRFQNGSEDVVTFQTIYQARCYARDKVSYSGGRVAEVILTDEYGSNDAIWRITWDAVSKHAGLNAGM